MDSATVKILKAARNAGFEVKGVKSFTGMEGYGFNANLYFNGKKVATVTDEGNGGCFLFRWERSAKGEAAEKAMDALIETLPEVPFGFTEGSYKADADTVLTVLVEYKEQALQCKRKTLFIHDEATYAINTKFDDRVKAHLAAKYPGCTILNEVFAEIEAA